MILLDNLRGVFTVAVSGHEEFDVALAAADCLFVAAVSAVVSLLVLVIVFAVAELFFKPLRPLPPE